MAEFVPGDIIYHNSGYIGVVMSEEEQTYHVDLRCYCYNLHDDEWSKYTFMKKNCTVIGHVNKYGDPKALLDPVDIPIDFD